MAIFLADSPYIDSCFNLSTMVTFFCPQGGRCREDQLQFLMNDQGSRKLIKIQTKRTVTKLSEIFQ